jgi:predicted component of type VI protein secretion system
MRKLNRMVAALGMALLFTGSVVLIGCSSSPSEEEMKQLSDLKEEVTALKRDQAVVKQRLANQ